MEWWQLGAAANALVAVAYLLVGLGVARNGVRAGPLTLVTLAALVTGAVHHGWHTVQLLAATDHAGVRAAWGWGLSGWDVATAAAAVWAWTQRGRYAALLGAPPASADTRQRTRRLVQAQDDVVQGLAVAKYAFDAGDAAQARSALDAALSTGRAVLGELIEAQELLGPGDLVRSRPAGHDAAAPRDGSRPAPPG